MAIEDLITKGLGSAPGLAYFFTSGMGVDEELSEEPAAPGLTHLITQGLGYAPNGLPYFFTRGLGLEATPGVPPGGVPAAHGRVTTRHVQRTRAGRMGVARVRAI